jgi:hypothetical protein
MRAIDSRCDCGITCVVQAFRVSVFAGCPNFDQRQNYSLVLFVPIAWVGNCNAEETQTLFSSLSIGRPPPSPSSPCLTMTCRFAMGITRTQVLDSALRFKNLSCLPDVQKTLKRGGLEMTESSCRDTRLNRFRNTCDFQAAQPRARRDPRTILRGVANRLRRVNRFKRLASKQIEH